MSFQVSWYIPERVIYMHILGELGLAEVEKMSVAVAELLKTGVVPVHILLDDSKGGKPPLNLRELKARMEVINQPTIGFVIGIGEVDSIAKYLVPLLMKIVRIKYTRVGTIQEAVQFLAKSDTSLSIEVTS